MSSYVNKKTRVFTSPGSTKVIQKRSESRLKSIRSATDNRAWTDCVEDRRQYILELIKTKAGGLSLGKYIPIEVIIDCLLANKNAQIAALQRQLDAYKKGGGAPAPKPKPAAPVPAKKEEPPKVEKKVEAPPPPPPPPPPPKVEPTTKEEKPIGPTAEEIKQREKEKKEQEEKEKKEREEREKKEQEERERREREEREREEREKKEIEEREKREREEREKAEREEREKTEREEKGMGEKDQEEKKEKEERRDVEEVVVAAPLEEKDKIEKADEDKGLRSEFQRIVVGDVSRGESQLKDGAQDDSLRRSFAKIAEAVDDGMEKGIIEASSPKDKDEMILLLQKKLEEQRFANQLAQRAINQLEGVEKILDQGLKLRCNLTCTNVCDPCPVKVKKMNNIDNMKQRLDDLMRERDGLKLKVSDLEKQMVGPGNGCQDDVECVSPDELRDRLDRVTGLEIKAQDLVNQLCTESSEKPEKPKEKEQKSPPNTDKLKAKISELEKELERTQQMKVDNAKMKMKIQELAQVEKNQDEMRKKIGKMENDYKLKFDDLCKMEVECSALRNQLANTKLMQKERDMLRRQVGDLECCVADLEDEIKRLTSHIDRLTEGRDEQQNKMQTVVSDVRIDLEKKNLLIQKLEEKLAKVQEELEKSIQAVKSECLCYKSKIEDLERMLHSKTQELKTLHERSKKEKDKLNEDIAKLKKTHEESIKAENSKCNKLKQQLDNCAKNNEKLQMELEKMIAFKSNEDSMKKILIHSRSAIKRVRQEIDMQYKEWEKGSGEDYKKVEELKDVIELLESEIFHLKQTNDELQTALKDQKKCNCLVGSENKSLKKHSTEIQCMAKAQVEELLKYLKKAQLRIIELEGLIDQKPIKVGQGTGDDDVTCDCDTDLLEKLMKENEILKQGLRGDQDTGEVSVEQGPAEKGTYNADQDLLNEIKRLKNEISSLESDKLKLEKENENLRTKSQFSKSMDVETLPTSSDKDKLEKIISAQREEIERLKQEIENLKKQLGKQAQVSLTNLKNMEDSLKTQKDTSSKMQLYNKDLEDKLKMLTEEIDNLRNRNKELNDQLDEMGKIKKQLDECLEKKKSENIQISSDNQNLKTDVADLENLKKKLAECLEREKSINAEKSAREEDLRRELENCKNKLKEMEKVAPDDSLKKENEDMKRKLKEMEDIKKQLTDCLNKANELNAQKSASEKDLKKENDDLKKTLNELEKCKKNLAECLEKEKKTGTKDSNVLQSKIEALQKQLDECLAREKKVKEVADKESYHSAVQVLPKDAEKLEKDLDDTKKKLADANKKLNELEQLKAELDKCRKENNALKGELDEMKKKPATAPATTTTAKPASAAVTTTTGKPPDDSEELEKLRREIQKLREENEKLKALIEKAEPKPAAAPAATQSPGAAQSSAAAQSPAIVKSPAASQSPGVVKTPAASQSPTVVKSPAETQSPAPQDVNLQAEIDRLLKKLEEQKKECDKTIKTMKNQYDRDVKNIKNASEKSIEKLQQQHQQESQDLESRHDSVVKSLKDELRLSIMSTQIPTRDKVEKSDEKTKKDKELTTQTFCVCSEMPKIVPIITTLGADIGIHEVESPYDKPGRWPKPKDNRLAQILFRASNLGLEKLTLDELRIVSSKLNEIEEKVKGPIIRPPRKAPADEEDQSSLMDKIEELKDNLEKKQRSAKHKVVNLQLSIRSMEQKILDTRNVLEKEKKHNAELRARLTMMERDSQLMQVDRDLMKQQTNLQEQHIAELKKTCECKKSKTKDLKREYKKKKFLKRSRRDSFSSDSTEILEQRLPSKRRSASTPVSGVRTPHHIPSIERVPTPNNDRKKRDKHGACPCCSTREIDKKN